MAGVVGVESIRWEIRLFTSLIVLLKGGIWCDDVGVITVFRVAGDTVMGVM